MWRQERQGAVPGQRSRRGVALRARLHGIWGGWALGQHCFPLKGSCMVGSGAVGIGFAADGGWGAGVRTWSTLPGAYHLEHITGEGWEGPGGLCFPATFLE